MKKLRCMIIRATGEVEHLKRRVEQNKVVLDRIKHGDDAGYSWRPRYHLNRQVHERRKLLGFLPFGWKRYNIFQEGGQEDENPENPFISEEGRTHREMVQDAKRIALRMMGKQAARLDKIAQLLTYCLVGIVGVGFLVFIVLIR